MIVSGNLFYPMTADVYYSTMTQDDLGQMVKSWRFDRTVKCSAIKERAEYNAKNSVSAEKLLAYVVRINFRCPENILMDRAGQLRRPTDALVAKIKDPAGNYVWSETPTTDTTFEIESIEPLFDENHVLGGYRALLSRSQDQERNYVQ